MSAPRLLALLLCGLGCVDPHPGTPGDIISAAPTGFVSLQVSSVGDKATGLQLLLSNGRYTPVEYSLGCPFFERVSGDGGTPVEPQPFCESLPPTELLPLQAHLRELPQDPALDAGTYRMTLSVKLGSDGGVDALQDVVSPAFIVSP